MVVWLFHVVVVTVFEERLRWVLWVLLLLLWAGV